MDVITTPKGYELSEKDYVTYITNLAKYYNKESLLLSLPWVVEQSDPFWRTRRGVVRYHCVLSLEFLFNKVLKVGGDWSKAHHWISKVCESTNPYMAMLACKSTGSWRKQNKERRLRLEDTHYDIELINMYLCYRGFFKTTLISTSLSVQELIIFPNARLLISSGSLDTSESILAAIKSHFTMNERFRYYFPEYCPKANKVGKIEFGTKQEFTLPNRTVFDYREPTCLAASPSTKLTGLHFNKHILDDLIDEKNVTTQEQLNKVEEQYQLSQSLFDNPAYPFVNVVGTHYSMRDIYMKFKKKVAGDSKILKYNTYNPVSKELELREKRV